MLFYMTVRYEGDNGERDLELNNLVNNGTAPYHGKTIRIASMAPRRPSR